MNGWSLCLLILGWLLGGSLPAAGAGYGLPLDAPEQAAMAETFQYAMEHNQHQQESTWVNPDSGHAGTIMPVRTFYSAQGLYCREYFQTLRFDEILERRLGIACRQPDGGWEVLHEQLLSAADLELEASRYTYTYRDPSEHYYPWVYYDPFDYPYPIYFSFVFVSHHHHFQPRHFHSGHRFDTHQFHDERRSAPRQRLHRDQRSDTPLVREQPTAPRFDRGQAPRQRLDGERRRDRVERRDQRVQQPADMAPGVRVIDGQPPPANPSPKAIRIDRGERREPRAEAPPAAPRLRQERNSGNRDGALPRSDQLRGQGQDRSGSQLRGGEGSRDNDRGRRGGELRRSDRDRRDTRERDEFRGSGSGGRGRR